MSKVTEFDLRKEEFKDPKLKPEMFEFDATGEVVRKDRFEIGMRRIQGILIEQGVMSPREPWTVDQVVQNMKDLIERHNAEKSTILKIIDQKNLYEEKLKKSMTMIDSFFDEQVQQPTSREYVNFIAAITHVLKIDCGVEVVHE